EGAASVRPPRLGDFAKRRNILGNTALLRGKVAGHGANSIREGPLPASPMKGEVKRAFAGTSSQVPRRGTSPFMGLLHSLVAKGLQRRLRQHWLLVPG